MSANIIQAQYDTLDSIAARFNARAEATTDMHSHIMRGFEALTQDGWEGKGVAAFSAEMNGEIFPAVQRMTHALQEAQAVTLEAKAILQQAEEEAQRLFGGEGFVGAPGGGSGAMGAPSTPGGSGQAGQSSNIQGFVGAITGGIMGAVGVLGNKFDRYKLYKLFDKVSDAKAVKGTLKGVGKLWGYIGLALDGLKILTAEDKPAAITEVLFSSLGVGAGAKGGAFIGAAFGGPFGAVIGAIGGGIFGSFVSSELYKRIGGHVTDIGVAAVEHISGFVSDVTSSAQKHISGFVADTSDSLKHIGGALYDWGQETVDDIGGFVSDVGGAISNIRGAVLNAF
jgi:WXG100 family type VII secretion target